MTLQLLTRYQPLKNVHSSEYIIVNMIMPSLYLDTHPINKSAVANRIIKAKIANTDLIDFIHCS